MAHSFLAVSIAVCAALLVIGDEFTHLFAELVLGRPQLRGRAARSRAAKA
jgi:hypothetical protein